MKLQGAEQVGLGLGLASLQALEASERAVTQAECGVKCDQLVQVLPGFVEASAGDADLSQRVQRTGYCGVDRQGQSGFVVCRREPPLIEQRDGEQGVRFGVVGLLRQRHPKEIDRPSTVPGGQPELCEGEGAVWLDHSRMRATRGWRSISSGRAKKPMIRMGRPLRTLPPVYSYRSKVWL